MYANLFGRGLRALVVCSLISLPAFAGDVVVPPPPPPPPPPPVSLDPLLSVNVNTNQLVRLNPLSGATTTIGTLRSGAQTYDIRNPDLAYLNGFVYALDTDPLGTGRSELLTINPSNAEIISRVTVKNAGADVPLAEGLAALNGQLWIGFRPAVDAYLSNRLGRLGLDGTISGVLNYSTTGADFDGLGDMSGGLFSVDGQVVAGGAIDKLYALNSTAVDYNLLTSIEKAGYDGVNDATTFEGRQYLIDGSGRLDAYDAASGRVTSITTGSGLYGITTPEPTTAAALLLTSLLVRRR